MTTVTNRENDIQTLSKLIKGIRFAMLTTAESDGTLRSRPMGTLDIDFDGTLWFFTQASAPKADEVRHDEHVNLSYADPDDNRFVSVSGTGQIVRDRQRMEKYWNPALKIWFKDGLDDPDLALLKVTVEQAEYWKSSSNSVGKLVGFVTAYITGNDDALGENKKIEL